MANAIAPNVALPSNTNTFAGIWKLTRCMKKAGWTYKASGSGNGGAKDTTGTAANDKWGGNADPMVDDMTTCLAALSWGAWICFEGPDTLKVPIGGASTGTFLRGEKVTQATSGAEGELNGYLWDSVSGTGWLVVVPRTGTFDGTHAITGASSAATITPSADPLRQVHQVVFWRNNANDSYLNTCGIIMIQCIETANQAGALFSEKAADASCSATIAPGGGGSVANGFATTAGVGSYVARGGITSPGAAQTMTWGYWTGSNVGYVYGKVQIGVANAIGSAGVTPDGSFYCFWGVPSISVNSNQGFMFSRMDDTEDGDVDLYGWIQDAARSGSSSNSYLSRNGATSTSDWNDRGNHWNQGSGYSNTGLLLTTKRRGLAAGAVGAGWMPCDLVQLQQIPSAHKVSMGRDATGAATPMRVGDHPGYNGGSSPTSPLVQEPMWFVSCSYDQKKLIKGTLRWMKGVSVGAVYDGWDSLQAWQVCAMDTANMSPGILVGPWDGSTTPVQS